MSCPVDVHVKFALLLLNLSFYHATVTKPLVRDLSVLEVSSHTAKMVPVQSQLFFSTKRFEKSLCDFTGTVCSAWVNPDLNVSRIGSRFDARVASLFT